MSQDHDSREFGQHLVDEVLSGRMTRRQLLVRGSVFGLSMTAIGSLLAACGSSSTSTSSASPSSAPKTGGVVRAAAATVLSAFDPVTMYQTGDIATVEQICEYLTWVEYDLTLRPVLAVSWSPDSTAKVWTFKLRQGVKFNDGSPFGADDVVATFDRLVNPTSGSGALSALKGILSPGGTVKVDDSTVAFHLDRAFADFPYLVSSGDYNSVILPRNFDGDFLKNPVGTGPFMLTNYQVQHSSTLKKNPNYWQKGLPYLDGVDFVYNPSAQSQIMQLQGGVVDLVVQMAYQGSEALFKDPSITVHRHPSTAMREVAMRADRAPFTDYRVRQAVAYCLDRPGLITGLYGGNAILGNDEIFCPLYPNSPSLPQRTQDYAKAKSLLAAAGHPSGVNITLTVPSAYLDLSQYATLIQSMCKPAGINVKIALTSETAYYGGSGLNQPWLQLPMDIVEWSPRPVAAQYIQGMLLSSSVWNSSHWANPQFDSLFARYEATLDQASRTAIATQMATLQQEQTPIITAFWITSLRAASSKVQNIKGLEAYLDLSTAYLS